jgi:hypothetical protein
VVSVLSVKTVLLFSNCSRDSPVSLDLSPVRFLPYAALNCAAAAD